jgi:glycosyltransferase involved in cell wall biosynthesis
MCHDVWRDGDVMLRAWLVDNAQLIMVSPNMIPWINWRYKELAHFVPSPIDIGKFKSDNTDRNGKALWVGRLHRNKGVTNAIHWAESNDVTLDIYGYGATDMAGERYRGEVSNDALPALLADYSQFVFLPGSPDACPRTTIEAYMAGCELVINDYVGSKYWFTQQPNALTSATSDFWRVIDA